jgi:NAD(P)-dependent dehydrogenase (short-subunit alcohol dehydrogenase family)/TolB-like protein
MAWRPKEKAPQGRCQWPPGDVPGTLSWVKPKAALHEGWTEMTDSAPPEDVPPPAPAASRWVRLSGLLKRFRGPIVAVGAFGAVLSGLLGYWRAYETVQTVVVSKPAAPAVAADAGPLSIVVLPFKNLTGDATQAYVADGLTASLTADLSRIREAFIVNAATAFAYKDKPVTAQQVGKDLGVHFLLQGSVQRNATKIRISAQLADANSNALLWSDTFEGDQSDLFALQDQVTARIANSIGRGIVIVAARESESRKTSPKAAHVSRIPRRLCMKKLDGKVAIVTGASSGIGLATAKCLAAEGAFVFVTGRRRDELDAAVAAIGTDAIAIRGDMSNLADLDNLFDRINAEKGRIDILFANAGVGEFLPLGAITEAHFDKTCGVNVKGTLFTVQKALPLMPMGSSIVINASMVSIKGLLAFSVYAATKAALRSFARSWIVDLKDRQIRVNVVSPGTIPTPGYDNFGWSTDQMQGFIAAQSAAIPLGRVGMPEEVAKAVLFLSSDDSSYANGIELFVDGGLAQI